jgi:sugar lactone lactonase YvrE
MSNATVTVLRDARASLGEGPSWDAHKQCLYWVDIDAGHLHVLDPNVDPLRDLALLTVIYREVTR